MVEEKSNTVILNVTPALAQALADFDTDDRSGAEQDDALAEVLQKVRMAVQGFITAEELAAHIEKIMGAQIVREAALAA